MTLETCGVCCKACTKIGARKTLIITAHQGRFIIILQDLSQKPGALALGGVVTIWHRPSGQVAVFSPPGVTINEFEKPDREQVLIIAGTTYRLSLLAGRGDSPRVTTWLIKDSPPPTNSENPEKSHDKQSRKPSHEWKLKEPRSVVRWRWPDMQKRQRKMRVAASLKT